MEEKNLKISIAHLYPKELNLFGDSANALVLKKRCEWRGIEVELNEINLGDEITEHDLYFICGGIEQQKVANELSRHGENLISQRDNGAVFLAVAGGFQLLGNSFVLKNGEKVEGVGLLDTYSELDEKRFTGNVTAITEFGYTLVGFENHAERIYLQGDTKPLATLSVGNGNNGKDMTEGARYKNVIGTSLHGPFLALNPHFADYLIELALEKSYCQKIKLSKLNDEQEMAAHHSLIKKSY